MKYLLPRSTSSLLSVNDNNDVNVAGHSQSCIDWIFLIAEDGEVEYTYEDGTKYTKPVKANDILIKLYRNEHNNVPFIIVSCAEWSEVIRKRDESINTKSASNVKYESASY